MRRDLSVPIPKPVWPDGFRLAPFAITDLPEIHTLLVLGYALGGGSVTPFEIWKPSLLGDSEFDPALVFLVRDDTGRLAAVCQCWTTAFVKDLVVHPAARRKGLGEALLHHAFTEFAARSAKSIDLKVEADNPSGARRLYERVGMVEVAA
jgi:ribosomal protein S18 acetylase RimI-like enzyme